MTYRINPEIRKILDSLIDGTWNIGPDDFKAIYDDLLGFTQKLLVSHADLPQTLQPDESMDVQVELNAIGNKGYNTYHIYVYELSLPDEVKDKSAKVRASALAQAYADRLTEILKRYPHQWLNYYEFWGEEN